MCQLNESDILAKYFAKIGMEVETEEDDVQYNDYLRESVQEKWDRITKDCYTLARENVLNHGDMPRLIITMDENGLGEEIYIKIAVVYYRYILRDYDEKESRAKLKLIKGKFLEEEKRKAADRQWYLDNIGI